jgi:inorganic pyrophosphatase
MLGQIVKVIVDRPMGTYHPTHKDIYYSVNYGYIPGIWAADGEEQDAYILGVNEPVKEFTGRIIAIIHRFDDVEEKWVVAPKNASFTEEEIMTQVSFQEQYFQTEIIMNQSHLKIRPAVANDKQQILKYDRHIHDNKVGECIDSGLVYVLCDDDKIVGILRYNLFWQSIPFLDLIYIDEAYRGQGWGSKMMADWEETMKRMGYSYAMLSTQEDESAKYFYEKLGYRRIGAFLPPEQEADEIMYLKELTQ